MISHERVMAVRKSLGISVADAAKQVRIERRSWQRYESGERVAPAGLLELFCIKNGLDYHDTFERSETIKKPA